MFRPLGDKVVVKRDEAKEQIRNGIYVPVVAQEKPVEGEVLSVGWGTREGNKVYPVHVEVGDKVLFGKYSGTEIKVDGDDVLLLREEEILGVL